MILFQSCEAFNGIQRGLGTKTELIASLFVAHLCLQLVSYSIPFR